MSGWFTRSPGPATGSRPQPAERLLRPAGRPARPAAGRGFRRGAADVDGAAPTRALGLTVPLRLLVSARTPGELIYARELGAETTPVYTPARRPGRPWAG